MRRSIRYAHQEEPQKHKYLISDDNAHVDAIWQSIESSDGKMYFLPEGAQPVPAEKGIPLREVPLAFAHLLEGGKTDFGVRFYAQGKMHDPPRAHIVLDARVIATWPPPIVAKLTIL